MIIPNSLFMPRNQSIVWKKDFSELDFIHNHFFDAWNWLIFYRSFFEYEYELYSVQYNWKIIFEELHGLCYEWNWYWYSMDTGWIKKYHFDTLIFEIENTFEIQNTDW